LSVVADSLAGMQSVLPYDTDISGLEEAAGRTSYARGVKYARDRAVLSVRWDEHAYALRGQVRGSWGEAYETTAYFTAGRTGRAEFAEGECSCPVSMDCKHAVALVLTATGQAAQPRPEPGAELWSMLRAATAAWRNGPPKISPPTLVLHAVYGDDHRLDVSWTWEYQIDDQLTRAIPGGPPAPYRDLAAESALLAELDELPLDGFGLRHGRRLQPGRLRGIETMRFTTEVLPLFARPGVVVSADGEPADYREVGDSLRIGVSTSDLPDDNDWYGLGVTITVEGREVPFLDVFVALARDRSHLLLADGAYFSLEKPELRALRELIDEARSLHDASDGTLRISRYQAGLWEELAQLGVVEQQASAWERQVSGLLSLDSVPRAAVPGTVLAQLRPYQVDGYQWLAFLWEHRLGGILADDMGLGKTLQSLALICHAAAAEPFLIVAPTSVVGNWVAEAARFAPHLRVAAVTKRGPLPTDADVVVTSYALLRLNIDTYADVSWAGLIMDEAQYTKNHQSKVYEALRRLPAPVKFAITGTPWRTT